MVSSQNTNKMMIYFPCFLYSSSKILQFPKPGKVSPWRVCHQEQTMKLPSSHSVPLKEKGSKVKMQWYENFLIQKLFPYLSFYGSRSMLIVCAKISEHNFKVARYWDPYKSVKS